MWRPDRTHGVVAGKSGRRSWWSPAPRETLQNSVAGPSQQRKVATDQHGRLHPVELFETVGRDPLQAPGVAGGYGRVSRNSSVATTLRSFAMATPSALLLALRQKL